MKAIAFVAATVIATGAAMAAGEDVIGGFRKGADDVTVDFGSYGPFTVGMRGDQWCGQTFGEVPNPPKIIKVLLQPAVDALPHGVVNAMLVTVAQVNANGEVTDVEVRGGWPQSARYEGEFRKSVRTWKFASGHPGQYCATLFIDVDGQVMALYAVPDKAAPKPSVATEIPFPEFAYENAVKGTVTLSIDVGPDGKVMDARTVREAPKGYGFGRSAVETVMAEWRFEGAPEGRYRLKLSFAP